MSDKKHIDRLFQEKLKNFEAAPSDAVWDQISAKLEVDKPKRRRFVPFWVKITGIAAGLLLLVAIGSVLYKDSPSIPETIVNVPVETDSIDSGTTEPSNTNKEASTTEETTVHNRSEMLTNSGQPESQSVAHKEAIDGVNTSQDRMATPRQNSPENDNNTPHAVASQNRNTKSAAQTPKDKTVVPPKTTNSHIKGTEAMANTPLSKNQKGQNLEINNPKEVISAKIQEEKAVAQQDNLNASPSNSQGETLDKSTQTSEEAIKEAIKELPTIEEAIASAEDALENEEDTKDEKTKPETRWTVAPNIAPVYFNSLGGSGSSIHSQFNSNDKSGDINMSYGVSASYALNHRLSVRAGVHRVNLGYSTNGIVTYNNIETPVDEKPIKTIAFNEAAQDVTFVSADDFFFGQIPSVLSDQLEGSIDQKLGFIEVPLELQYKISDKKIGLRVIGGFSALFLNENEVYSSFQGRSTLIGKATNVNSTSFSANLGLGFDFKLSKRFNFNLEPTFKYQLNTFSDTTGDFRPYFIGLYSGLQFKF